MPPASRHLWVGNLPHGITDVDLTRLFSRFGDIKRIAFLPGRSYAFIDLGSTDEAVSAMEALDGFAVAGNPLRVEFTKVDKSPAASRDEEHLEHRDPQRSSERALSFSQKDSSKFRHGGADRYHPEKSKIADKSSESEPSEVLWIGFPAQLKVDETILRKAFSPYGEIDKITAFPGRTYAFVRFRDLISACRAKETLQGKLFGNPRVHICFARSESGGGGSSGGKSSVAASLSPRFKSGIHDFGGMRSPRFISKLEAEDPDIYTTNRRGVSRSSADRLFGYDQRRFTEEMSEVGFSPNVYEYHGTPVREKRGNFPHSYQKGPDFDPWDLPEETDLFPGAKRQRTSAFHPDNDLLEYDYADLKHERQALPQVTSDFVQPERFDRNTNKPSHHLRYQEMPDRRSNLVASHGERSDHLRAYYDHVHVGSGQEQSISIERKRVTTESNATSQKEWKWEGTIAKGGNPICRARCFPVGKSLDMVLPEFLDCTARTSLDMLSKHYYQAAGAWVIFFVPGSDADIGFYNEFMHYLEEKQRAAVAKLDDRTTMFLVPPSDFSQKVLKVPGNLSISGVVLRLENPLASKVGSLNWPDEVRERHDHPELLRSSRESLPYPAGDVGASLKPVVGQSLSSHYLPSSIAAPRNNAPFDFPSSSNGINALQEMKASGISSIPNPELLVQLASSLIGQQRQSPNAQNALMGNQSQPEKPFSAPEGYNFLNIKASSEVQPYHPQQQSNFSAVAPPVAAAAVPAELQTGAPQGNQQVPSSGVQEGDNDPQKRLQATLQLAASLLQQIQQGKGT
ncbi:flowering time control protein FPA isoform X1 [Punica granatum]|uniref:Flowering time control protein FPA isoform X1 n=1 Tax=Punica granatum TaxID=22663 RepID=A0A6P8BPH2_PUNGR|nr:flowering time control protein FPA isoform X1 [Punica granatum]